MPTVWTPLGALVFDPFTTAQRDALVAQEHMVIYNSTTSRFEIYIGSWRDFAEYIGTIGLSEHEEIASGDLHPEYAHPQQPEEITGTWALLSGGRITPVSGDPPEGEVIIQVKTTAGAPTHSASRGVFCLVAPDSVVYLNMVGGTTWVRLAKYSELHAEESGESTTHNHGNLYYTEAETDGVIDTDIATHAALEDEHHTNDNDPSAGEKAALPGTSGSPGAGNKYVTDDDSRNTDSRAPSGSAGGDLSGTYPNPTIAAAKQLKCVPFAGTQEDAQVETMLRLPGICIGESGEMGTVTGVRFKVSCGVAGVTGTMTVKLYADSAPNFPSETEIASVDITTELEDDDTSISGWVPGTDNWLRAKITAIHSGTAAKNVVADFYYGVTAHP